MNNFLFAQWSKHFVLVNREELEQKLGNSWKSVTGQSFHIVWRSENIIHCQQNVIYNAEGLGKWMQTADILFKI